MSASSPRRRRSRLGRSARQPSPAESSGRPRYQQGGDYYKNALWTVGYGGVGYAPDRVADCKRVHVDLDKRRAGPGPEVYSHHYQPGHYGFGTQFLRTGVTADEAAVADAVYAPKQRPQRRRLRDYRHFQHQHRHYDDESESDDAGSEYESDDEVRRRRRKKFVYVDSKRFTRHKRPFVVRARECPDDEGCSHCSRRWGEDRPRRAVERDRDEYDRHFAECMRTKGYY